jgi:hypothetical protein
MAMNDRANILARLRRWKSGAARYVVASFAVAYLSVGVAPCAMAATRATDDVSTSARESAGVAHEHHVAHEPRHPVAHSQHGHEDHDVAAATHDNAHAAADHGDERCLHCPPGTQGDHAACVALEDLTHAAAAHAKDAPQPLAPLLAPAAFMPPPPLASPWPSPPSYAVRVASVPLNVRHCVFLI